MNAKYNIFFIYEDKEDIAQKIEKEIQIEIKNRFGDITTNYLSKSVNISHNKRNKIDQNGLNIAIYLGSKKGFKSKKCVYSIKNFIELGILIIPIIENPEDFNDFIPYQLQPINAFIWEGEYPEKRITIKILENLGLSEKDRKVFISYRRIDGIGMADQLLDILTRQGFNVFMDKYDIDYGRDVQHEIFQSIDEKSFLVVIESPKAYESEWISKEIHYALRTHIPVSILTWFNTTQTIEDTEGLQRIYFNKEDLYFDKYFLIKEEKIESVVVEIESIHSNGLFRRRNLLIRSIEYEFKTQFEYCNYLDNWILYLKNNKKDESDKIITITPRIPKSLDLYLLDKASEMIKNPRDNIKKILYHQAESVPLQQQYLLEWIIEEKLNIQIIHYIA